MPLADFGPRTQGPKGRYFCFYYDNNGTDTRFSVTRCGTLVALLCAERGGGHICNGPFARSGRWPGDDAYANGILYQTALGEAKISNTNGAARLFINGIRRPNTSGYIHAGCQVVAIQVPPAGFAAMSAEQYYTDQETSASGGLMFGEMLFWENHCFAQLFHIPVSAKISCQL